MRPRENRSELAASHNSSSRREQVPCECKGVRIGTVKEPYFIDSSEKLRNLPLLTSVVYSVAAVGVNGKESSVIWVQIVTPTFVPY